MKSEGRILIVDDDADILAAGKLLLKHRFHHVSTCNQAEHIPLLLGQQDFDVVLLDMNFSPGESSGAQGFYWLKKILGIKPETIIIMITAHGGIDIAVEAMKLGATDFIAKPWENEKVIATISTAILLGKSRAEAKELRETNALLVQSSKQSQPLIGNSPVMRDIFSIIERSAPTDANVLILGENGTGKEVIAREIHDQSLRCNNIFMSVDLGSISESLFESEIFGHKKGAFTGAQQDRVGRLKAADGGTLFLDEIGNLPLHLQAKLLTVIAQREVVPIGSNTSIPFDVRVICATNADKKTLTSEGHFRQDLLFRLNTVEIHLPTLKERPSDIETISQYYISHYCQKYRKQKKELSDAALNVLLKYSWPGNIRELRHSIERATILSRSDTLEPIDFQFSVTNNNHLIEDDYSPPNTYPFTKNLNLAEIEKEAISQALKKHKYNISYAAKELGLTRGALYRRMEKYDL